jgi:two-component system, chemotaxis family, sensor kinase CheA
MDQSAYLPAFLAEAREHLQDLGLAVVRIESAPDDRKTADRIFRIAHTLKGMSATMGFEAIATLTHAMEDVFELLRQRTDGLSHEAVDVLSACLDALETAVDGIAADGKERLDSAPLVAGLQQLARGRTPEQELDRDGGAALPDLARLLAGGTRVAHVVADLAPGAAMPGVRAFMLFEALALHGELVGSVPAREAAERFTGDRVEAWIATAADAAALHATAATIGDVARATVREVPTSAVPLPAAAPDAEHVARRTAATVRVDAERLDELLHLMGELVIHRTTVEALAEHAGVPGLTHAVAQLARSSQALQATVTRVRMVPVESVFLRFPRLVRDLAGRLGKQVDLRLVGQDTELDRTVVDALGDPLMHLVRNALDHGLEPPHERAAAGKPPAGTLELAARHAGGHVIVSVRDDGRGVDPAAVARIAFERGLLDADAAAALDAARASELLFAPGFSTAAATTDVSGRGVGMDAVRTSVRALGGEVTLESAPGAGSVARIRLPLTLASVSALLVTADGLPFAIPLDRVEHTLRVADASVRSLAGATVLAHDGEVLPMLDAGLALGRADASTPAPQRDFAVVVRGVDRRVALGVSALLGQRELVTRRLPAAVSARAAAVGGAVLPDGEIALVVDCDALAAFGNPASPLSTSGPLVLAAS